MTQEYVNSSDPQGEVVVDGSQMKFSLGLDLSESQTDVNNTQTTTVNQTINNQSGFGDFFKSGGAESLITAVVAIGGIALVAWAFFKKKKKKK